MARSCTICGAPRVTEIDRRLQAGEPAFGLARAFGIPKSSMQCHHQCHLLRAPLPQRGRPKPACVAAAPVVPQPAAPQPAQNDDLGEWQLPADLIVAELLATPAAPAPVAPPMLRPAPVAPNPGPAPAPKAPPSPASPPAAPSAPPLDWLGLDAVVRDLHTLAVDLQAEAAAAKALGQHKAFMDAADRLLALLDKRAKLGGLPAKGAADAGPMVSITFNLGGDAVPAPVDQRAPIVHVSPMKDVPDMPGAPPAVAAAIAAQRRTQIGRITIDLGE